MHPDSEFSRPELSALLAAASAPADPRELAGEQQALWQFRVSRMAASAPAPTRHRARRTFAKTALANAFAAKVALASAAAFATGGVVLAAETGHWPASSPVFIAAPSMSTAPTSSSQDGGSSDSAGAWAPAESADPSSPPGSESAPSTAAEPSESDSAESPGAQPTPSLTGLCTAYQAGATDNGGNALTNPAFSVLVSAAGGADNLAAFCTALVGPPPTHARPTPTSTPHHGLARGHGKHAAGTRGHGTAKPHPHVHAHTAVHRHGRGASHHPVHGPMRN